MFVYAAEHGLFLDLGGDDCHVSVGEAVDALTCWYSTCHLHPETSNLLLLHLFVWFLPDLHVLPTYLDNIK